MELLNGKGNCKSTHLDGIYFREILRENGIATSDKPIILAIHHDENDVLQSYCLEKDVGGSNHGKFYYYRVVIHSPRLRYSTLCIINPEELTCEWWNPRKYDSMRFHAQIKTIIYEYIRSLGDFTIKEIEYKIHEKHTFTTLYALKYALCHSFGIEFDHNNITGMMSVIEAKYPYVVTEDIEFDNTRDSPDNQNSKIDNVGLGILGGAAVGGLLGGGTGMLAGGLVGGIVGANISSKNDDGVCTVQSREEIVGANISSKNDDGVCTVQSREEIVGANISSKNDDGFCTVQSREEIVGANISSKNDDGVCTVQSQSKGDTRTSYEAATGIAFSKQECNWRPRYRSPIVHSHGNL